MHHQFYMQGALFTTSMNLQKEKKLRAHLPWCSEQLILDINVKNNVMTSIEIAILEFSF